MILCLGFSHQTASLALRERLNLTADDITALLQRFASHQEPTLQGLCELAIVSTCNRVEFYASLPEVESASALVNLLCQLRGVSHADVEPILYRHAGLDAVMHLCRVSAGLESMVLGETQILGQVIEAYEVALAAGAAGQVLSAVFQSAIRSGKRTHTQTHIGRQPATISSAAIRLAEQHIGPLANRCALVVGAGEMGLLAVKALKARSAGRILVANRTAQAAIDLTAAWGGEAVPFDQLPQALAQADLAIVCTAAPQPIITAAMAQAAVQTRPERAVVLVDISVPRNVAPEVGDVPGVYVLNLDDLNARVQNGMRERASAVPEVEQIVAQEVSAFDVWLRELEARDLIADLHKKAEVIRQRELQRTMRYLGDLDPQAQAHIQHLTQSLMDKLLHEPSLRLREEAGSAKLSEYASAVRELFGLDAEAPRPGGNDSCR